jgi:hypothetical protein
MAKGADVTTVRAPAGLGGRGRRLWRELVAQEDFDPAERVLVEEACRITDRLDVLHEEIAEAPSSERLKVMSEARQQANVLKQIVAALRLPDEVTGKRPGKRPQRGAYKPSRVSAVTSLERARAAKSG